MTRRTHQQQLQAMLTAYYGTDSPDLPTVAYVPRRGWWLHRPQPRWKDDSGDMIGLTFTEACSEIEFMLSYLEKRDEACKPKTVAVRTKEK